MIETTIEIRELIASDGKVLTDGTTYAKVVYLAPSEDEGKWHEIDESEVPQSKDESEVIEQ